MLQHEQIDPSLAEDQTLSALLDGELDEVEAERVFKRLREDPSVLWQWSVYCLIGDALRGEVMVQPKFEQRLRQALTAEPTLLAPMRRARRGRGYARAIAWTAAAAAVAAVTWAVWTALPERPAALQMAAQPNAVMIQASHVMPYLDAHQDFAQGVVAPPEMRFTQVTLVGHGGGQ